MFRNSRLLPKTNFLLSYNTILMSFYWESLEHILGCARGTNRLSQETCREISNTPSASRDVLTHSRKKCATKSSSGDVKHPSKAYIDVSIATTSRDVLVNYWRFFLVKDSSTMFHVHLRTVLHQIRSAHPGMCSPTFIWFCSCQFCLYYLTLV